MDKTCSTCLNNNDDEPNLMCDICINCDQYEENKEMIEEKNE